MKSDMIEFMEEVKADRLEREREAIIRNRMLIVKSIHTQWAKTQPVTIVLPGAYDVCEMKPFKRIIDMPSDVDVNESSFKDAMTKLDGLVDQWRLSVRISLAGLVPTTKGKKTKKGAEPDLSVLDLAATWFRCTSCYSKFLDAVQALGHHCATTYNGYGPREVKTDWEHERRSALSCTTWNARGFIEYGDEASMYAAGLVKLCGLNPATASRDQMAARRFRCNPCSKRVSNGKPAQANVMNFRDAVRHVRQVDHEGVVVPWTVLSEEDVRTVQERELAKVREEFSQKSPPWGRVYTGDEIYWHQSKVFCMHCDNTKAYGIGMFRSHLRGE